ncbi:MULTISPECIES: hypothetical protein [unclassified Romboutsia]|uniref:hypothetical protein n=1 Tax=unclassified Romboutsia TaxID=2626894 RepID=UPI0008204AA6|nr:MULTISPECIES: hypothetical protein [unclassified Romboutsia]SCH65048.1 Uncharacterised protein [uncultured Clostridium sp.]
MKGKFITKENIFIQPTKFSDMLINATGYESLYKQIIESKIEFNEEKSYDLLPSGFIDFNQHLYDDINHMNSISTGLFIERALITFRIFIWTSRGEGFEIFKHILNESEIDNLKNLEDVKEYLYTHLSELEYGIIHTYDKELKECYEEFGKGIEAKKLPLPSILKFLSIDNNISEFR